MKVRFKEQTNETLTKWKEYKVLETIRNCYLVINDKGNYSFHLKHVFEIVKSKQLKVGDVLLAKNLDDWCEAGDNYYFSKWCDSGGVFIGDRTIEKIEMKDGHKAFLVSDTAGAWIRAKGFRKFCKR